ncbi:hypothetical protein ZIOFF_042223 [Zingiber officinale]|uniref:protein-serine/threonine phosphatase n=1 Tax=Zingiber officinale TaxID=94328 RepID=A0A8J5L5X4_ZINOF|nr:hypothetical protein ZIOFF_042223 [Zingiber officinale]
MEGMENCEELETLVRDFDRIYQGYNDALLEIQSLKMSCNCEVMKREALEATCNDFKAGREHEKMIDMVKQECNQKIHDLEKQVSCSLDKQASDQVLINQFQRELVTHETHIDILTGNLEMVTSDLQSKYDAEILELKSQLLAEQNVKNDLQVKLQNTENECKRSSMEDFYETRIDCIDDQIVGLFGVFDGHGGAQVAEYVKQNLFSNLLQHPKFISDIKSALAEAYKHTDSEFLKCENSQNREAGSTASTAVLVGNRLVVANVGDSRVVICKGGDAIAVSRDHKPDQTDERQRIEDAGGFVMWAGTWRVGGVLAVSRAFGDRHLKRFVVADPEIHEEEVDGSLEFVILASDGLWDVVSNEEAVEMVKSFEDPEQAAKKLLQEAYQRGSADNITCVVVRFLASTDETTRKL